MEEEKEVGEGEHKRKWGKGEREKETGRRGGGRSRREGGRQGRRGKSGQVAARDRDVLRRKVKEEKGRALCPHL